jgi:hypothetical protein
MAETCEFARKHGLSGDSTNNLRSYIEDYNIMCHRIPLARYKQQKKEILVHIYIYIYIYIYIHIYIHSYTSLATHPQAP